MYPVDANIATRLCLSSAARNQRNVSSLPIPAKLIGSKLGIGFVEPSIPSNNGFPRNGLFFSNVFVSPLIVADDDETVLEDAKKPLDFTNSMASAVYFFL